ncbi:MAG TPA: hypothetical protein VHY10_16325 [Xanthobacteraceae bacterium]|jgi:hypothetical protein|nr:hypothetical protein [Xanthobacteraceae bacterium]
MKNFVRTLAIAALMTVAAGIGFAVGQQAGQYLISSPAGTEAITVQAYQSNGQPSPVNNYVLENTIRNTTGYQLSAAVSGTVVTTLATNNLIFTAALTGAVTADVPPSPPDGQLFSVGNGTSSAFTQTITLAATDGSTFANGNTAASLAAAGSEEWQYVASTAKWYRQR